jgi:hypothetical protein
MEPVFISSEAPSTALKPPKCLCRSSTTIIYVPLYPVISIRPWMGGGAGRLLMATARAFARAVPLGQE